MKSKLISAALIVFVMFAAGCRQRVEMVQTVMGVIPAKITVVSTEMSDREITRAIESAFAAIDDINDLMSVYVESSDVSRLNRSGPDEMVKLNAMTFEVLEQSKNYSRLTQGAFDVTVMPLVEIWGFYPTRKGVVPLDNEIAETLKKVGYDKLLINKVEKSAGFRVSGMKVDLGAIAKGYAVDQAMAVLKKIGVDNALVEIGGEVATMGRNAEDKVWRIGLQHPNKKLNMVMAVVGLEDRAVATSGDYQNFFEVAGVRYSHIIDPRTGRPVENNICSVTVLASACTEADALATGISVIGVEAGLELLNSRDDLEGIIIERLPDDELKIHLSEGLKGKIDFK